MPSWNPNWSDVRFDHVAAEQAADACERAARVLITAGAERRQLVQLAVASGHGPAIDALARRNAAVLVTESTVAASLRSTAARLRSASQAAAGDQAHREAERLRWRADKADEDRLLAAAASQPPAAAA